MKLLSGKRIGQSGYELTLAVFFSFFLHAAIVVAALFLYMAAAPKIYVPPFYEVKLVGVPAEIAPAPQVAPSPPMAAPKTEAPPKPAAKKAQPKLKKGGAKAPKVLSKKGAIPELNQQKPKVEHEGQKQEELKQEAAPAKAPAAPAATQGGKPENVTVSVGGADQKFLANYSNTITTRISLNWNPPPGLKGLKAKVQFTVNRSGMITSNPQLVEPSGNFYFDQAAIRAIQQSNPFPPMPEDYYKQTAVFSVDLVPID